MAAAGSNSFARYLIRYRHFVVAEVIWVGLFGYAGWYLLGRPWSIAKEVVVGSTEHEVRQLLGQPDLGFRSNRELESSLLVPGGDYVFTPIPGPNQEWPLTAWWLLHAARVPPVSADKLPAIGERALWYDLPLTAEVLVYLKDGQVTRMDHGGT